MPMLARSPDQGCCGLLVKWVKKDTETTLAESYVVLIGKPITATRLEENEMRIEEIMIYPFTIDDDGDQVNTYAEGYADSEIDGWYVAASKADGGEEDEQEFDNFDAALVYAEGLSSKHGVNIDKRW